MCRPHQYNTHALKRKCIAVLVLMFVSLAGYSKAWVLFNANLEIKFDDQKALLTVKDKRCNKVWQQSPLAEKMTVTNTLQKGNTLSVSFSGKYSLNTSFKLNESALEITVLADPGMPVEELAFPVSCATPAKNHYLLYPAAGGFLLPADNKEYPVSNSGSAANADVILKLYSGSYATYNRSSACLL